MIKSLLQKSVLSVADRKTVSTCKARIESINTGIIAAQPDRPSHVPGWRSVAHLAMDTALENLHADFAPENIEAFHQAFVRNEQSALTAKAIGAAGGAALEVQYSILRPIIGKVIADAEAKVNSEAQARREALSKAESGVLAGDESAALESRVADAKSALAAELAAANGDPVGWLTAYGIE